MADETQYDATGRMIRTWDKEKEDYKKKYGSDVDYQLAKEMEQDSGFQKAMKRTRVKEGGYNNDPTDRGGETNYGISSAYYPEEDKKNLTRERADYILYRDYYKVRGIEKLPEKTREVVFDNAVIQGQPTAVIQLQRVVGAKQDGFIGEKTLEKVKGLNEKDIIDGFRREAINNAHAIVKRNKSQQKYHKGWINRAEEYQ